MICTSFFYGKVLKDDYLQEIAEKLSNDWWETSFSLDIPHCDVQALEEKFPKDVKKRAFYGLTLWKKKKLLEKIDQNAMIDELINALKKVKREDLAFTISSDRGTYI